MGQESSTLVDEDTRPQTLKDRSVESVAKLIKNGRARKIVVMVRTLSLSLTSLLVHHILTREQTGAGISTAAGIPDFRSPDTGLYANLARLNLPYAEAVFSISYFRQNPVPFYALAHELYPGKFRPTISHSFIRLLSDKGLLLKLFTQNIDCLEREAGVPDSKIVEAHGSFAQQRCIECKTPYPDDLMRQAITRNEVPYCLTPQCNGLVKPDIVFFGEQLPEHFHQNRTLPAQADLCIVMGTSLSVQPFASLPGFCAEGVPRLLINKERVGGLGSRADDVLLLGECDAGVRRLASALGWLDELEALWTKTNLEKSGPIQKQPEKTKDEVLEDEIHKLTAEVDQSLRLSNDHTARLRNDLGESHGEETIDEGGSDASSTFEITNAKVEKMSTPSNGATYEAPPADSHSTSPGSLHQQSTLPNLSHGPEDDTQKSELDHVFPHIAEKPSL